MKNWIVDSKQKALVLEPSGGFMQATCHHRGRGKSKGACGGCYARLGEALNQIETDPREALRIVRAVHASMMVETKVPA